MYLITLTLVSTGEEINQYTNPLPMSEASINHLGRTYGIAVTQVRECDEDIVISSAAA